MGHDDSHIDNYDEDVSSEGSCRTSIYNRSQRGDEDDKHPQSVNTGGDTKASHESSKKSTPSELAHRGNLDKVSSKYSFQSKIPRLVKPLGKPEERPKFA